MSTGILGLGTGGASALNQEVIDKLKAADTKTQVDPITKRIENITSLKDGEEGEQFKFLAIKAKVAQLVVSMSILDLNSSKANVFDGKSSNITGTSATFSSDDMSLLPSGVTKVNVTQLATKDIYQSGIFSDKTANIANGQDINNTVNVSGVDITDVKDFIAIQVAKSPVYQSIKTNTTTSTTKVGAGTFTITPAGGSAITITTDANTTWDGLKTLIDADTNLEASFVNNRLQVTHKDKKTALTIADTSGEVSRSIGLTRGRKFKTVGKTYESLATSISKNSKLDASVEQVGDNDYRFVIKSALSGTANELTITQIGVGLSSQTTSKYFSNTSAQIENGNDSGDMITIKLTGEPVYQSTSVSTSTNSDKVGAGTFTVTPAGGSAITITTDENTTWDGLKDLINADANLVASYINDRLSIKSTDGTKTLTITDTSGTVSSSLGLSRGRKFTTNSKTYDQLVTDISNNPNMSATMQSGKIVITNSNNKNLEVAQKGVDLGFEAIALVEAKNMNATIDGVSYDTSANQISTVGGLKITAVATGESSLSISENTDLVLPAVEDFTKKYNELVAIVDEEVLAADSPMEDISSLRMMMSSIKSMIFGSYGAKSDQNIFNYGLELDKEGHLSINNSKLSAAISSNLDNVKALFIGDAVNEGLGTKLKSYLDQLTSYNGLLTRYDTNMDTRLEKLNEEKEKMVKTLDTKYASMAVDFASYGAIISQMEAQFSGLKMMIDQSIASK